MEAKAAPEKTLALACHWIRDPSTGRLEACWRVEAPVKREDILRHFTPAR
jgi:hypothetical protein